MAVHCVAVMFSEPDNDFGHPGCDCDVDISLPENCIGAWCTSGFIYVANDQAVHRCPTLTKDDEFDAFAIFVTLLPLIERVEA